MDQTTVFEELAAVSAARREIYPNDRRQRRQAANVTQAELAAAIGVTKLTLCRWEQGHNDPHPVHLANWLAALDALDKVPLSD